MLAFNSAFYRETGNFNFLNKMVEKVPQNTSVMTQNNLATRFTHQNIQLLNKDYATAKPDYILIDIRKGQNPNDFFGTSNDMPGLQRILQQILHDKNYIDIYKTKEQYVFKRK
jgi:hypothetical protein